MAKIALSQVPTGSTLIDEKTSFNGEILKWTVVAHDTDGSGVTTLILDPNCASDVFSLYSTSSANIGWDAKEPENPNEYIAEQGNPSYEYSNLLQFLNSDKSGGEWYEAQHQYDQAPTDDYVSSGIGFADHDAFLAHFSANFKAQMQTVTKYSVSRKVHLPGYKEIMPSNVVHGTDHNATYSTYDEGTQYKSYLNTYGEFAGGYFITRGTGGNTSSEYGQTHFLLPVMNIYKDTTFSKYGYLLTGSYAPYINRTTSEYAIIAPVIYVASDIPVALDDGDYFTAFPTEPTITVKDDFRSHAFAFDVVFRVNDLDRDTTISTVSIDGVRYYTNNNTPHATDIAATIPTNTFSALAYGSHTITITASDSENTVMATSKFYKSQKEMVTLASIAEKKVFVDRNTLYNGEPIEWIIVAKDIEGEGIVALMMKNPIGNYCYDAKETNNPDSTYSGSGNPDYATSNILQWLNSEKGANEWYEAQHQYDYPPNSDTVGGTYASEDGFLHNFGETLLNSMNEEEKMGVTRKVHIPSYPEIIGNNTAADYIDISFDTKDVYTSAFTEYIGLITKNESSSLVPAFYIRSKPRYSSAKGYIGTLRGTASGGIFLYYINPYLIFNSANPIYTLPVIYVRGEDAPVIYDAETDRYYLDYAFQVKYEDYGKHKAEFPFSVKIDGETLSGITTIKAYIDGSTEASATFEIETYNEYVNLTLPSSVFSGLSKTAHTVLLKAETYGITATASFTFTKIEDSVPVIISNVIGHVAETFATTYQVYDEDEDSLDVAIKIDGNVVETQTDVSQRTDLTYTMPVATFNSLSYGNHTLSITASDGVNTTDTNIQFTKNSVPSISLNKTSLGEVVSPFSIEVTANSADGGAITIKAYIDGKEIEV